MIAIRDARPDDATACAAIYAPYVTATAATFETVPPDAAELGRRIHAAQAQHAWLVAEHDGDVSGFAYGGPFRQRTAYDWSCETTVYLRLGLRRTGAGRALVTALLDRLAERGLRRAVAVIALPNDASIGLHRALGYRDAGVLERIGFKHGAWRDVAWLQKDLGPLTEASAPLR